MWVDVCMWLCGCVGVCRSDHSDCILIVLLNFVTSCCISLGRPQNYALTNAKTSLDDKIIRQDVKLIGGKTKLVI